MAHSIVCNIILIVEEIEYTPPSPHTRKQRNEKQHSRMRGKWSNAENLRCEESKQKQKLSHTGKIRKQKTT